ncbi:MAG TPA: SCP2 sterol-binding domain-containing protein [Thiobacillaceae bacterium]|nr:SCP2 sterol-binding domain-containing protein [Thiobacillaceae bacterium]HNU63464.1 SCP2 sterol-binding domain-containing protein [Thiobacillaceae bacterium]
MQLPAFPAPLARLVTRLPTWPTSWAFAAACNLAAWPTLKDLDWEVVRGRRFRVVVKDMGLGLFFSVTPKGFRAERNGLADVTFTATAQDFARLALRLEDPDTLFFNRRLLIEGDTDLGLMVKNMLDAVELETLTGNMPGPMGQALNRLRRLALAQQPV